MMFALFMIVILIVTGFIWLLDILVLRKKRPAGVEEPIIVEYAKSFFPVILVVKDFKTSRILGAVGLRYADAYPLFSENYLSQSIEQVIAENEQIQIARNEIIELGHFVVDQSSDVNLVIPMIARFLKSLNVKWVVYTLSRPIKVAFQRLGIKLTHLQHAHADALQNSPSDWGRYYDYKPAVYYSNILNNMNP